MFAFGIEQTIIGTTEAIGLQGSLQNVRLKQDGEAGKGALLNRGGGQRTQRRPDVLLGFWSHLDPLAAQNRTDPFGRPAAFGNVVDCGKRLERNEFRALSSERATEIVPIAAHGDCGCPDRTAEAPSRHGWYRYRRDGLCPTPCIRVFENTVVVDALGGRRLRNLTVRGSDGKTQNVAADVLAISGGWNQAMGIGCNLGSRPVWSDEIHAFLLASPPAGMTLTGSAAGHFSLAEALEDGRRAGMAAAADLGFSPSAAITPRCGEDATGSMPLWHVAGAKKRSSSISSTT